MKTSVSGRLKKAVAPPEAKIFELLETSADTTHCALEALENLVHHWPEQAHADELVRRRIDAERQAEAIFAAVNRTFLAWLESEDLLALSDAFADATAHAEEIAALLSAYRTPAGREHARRATHALACAGGMLHSGVARLQRGEGVGGSVDAADAARRRAVVFLREGLAELVADDPSATELAAWRDVSSQLAAIADACAAVARALRAVQLKGR